MLRPIIQWLDLALGTTPYFNADGLLGLAERRGTGDGVTQPLTYASAANWKPINWDQFSGSCYWRITSKPTAIVDTNARSARQVEQVTLPLRLVANVHRERFSCDDAYVAGQMYDTVSVALAADNTALRSSLGARRVSVTTTAFDHDAASVWAEEVTGSEWPELPLNTLLIAIDVVVTYSRSVDCTPTECDPIGNLLSGFNFCDNGTFSLLSETQIECLTDRLCEAPPTLCEQLAEIQPADVVADVFDCLTPEAQDELLDSECVIPPCSDATYTLKKSGGATISTGSIPSGGSQDITAPDASAVLKDSAGTTISTTTIQSNTSANITAPDGTVTINGTAMDTVKSNGSKAFTVTQGGVNVGSGSGTSWIVPTCPVAQSLAVSAATSTPAYAASVTITATPTGITPTSYTFSYPSDSVGGYTRTTQAGASLAITARGYGSQTILVTATDGVTTVGGSVTITVAQMTQVADFLTNTGIVDATISGAVRSLALRLDDYGIWSKVRALYPFVGGTATTHKYNLKDPRDLDAAYRMVFAGGWTHDANGVTGNGVNTSGDSRLANNVPGQNSLTLGVYNRTAGSGGVEWSGSVTPRTWLAGNISGTAYFDVNNGASTATTTAPADVRGTLMSSRIVSSATELNLNGQGQRTTAAASSAPSATNFIFGQFSGGGFVTSRNYAAAWITDGLTAEEETHFRSAMQTFQTTLGRNV